MFIMVKAKSTASHKGKVTTQTSPRKPKSAPKSKVRAKKSKKKAAEASDDEEDDTEAAPEAGSIVVE